MVYYNGKKMLASVAMGGGNADLTNYYNKSEVDGEIEKLQEQIDELKSSGGNVDLSNYYNKSQIDDMLNPISITSFINNVGTAEMGGTVTSVTLSWAFNKTPASLTLDGVTKSVTSSGETITGLSLKTDKTWTLKATDSKGETTKTTSISFCNGVYYGVSTSTTYNSSLISSLTKTLRGSKLTSFTATAGSGQYIYYCLPKRMGTCSFKVGGFEGGFTLVATISFTNSKGYAEEYYIYKSDNANLGSTTVSVS